MLLSRIIVIRKGISLSRASSGSCFATHISWIPPSITVMDWFIVSSTPVIEFYFLYIRYIRGTHISIPHTVIVRDDDSCTSIDCIIHMCGFSYQGKHFLAFNNVIINSLKLEASIRYSNWNLKRLIIDYIDITPNYCYYVIL